MIHLLISLFLLLTSCMKVDNSIRTNFEPVPTAPESGSSSFCPANFVRVPALSPYSSEDFCVSKYEMKILGQANGDQAYNAAFVADARADGTPWVNINRDQAIAECSAMGTGYELMTNGDWQTLARNIELEGWNWSGSAVGSAGGLSRSVGMAAGVAAGSDSDSCLGTGNACNLSTWNERRRVHLLSSGEYIWDVGGNVAEWVRDDSNFSDGFYEASQMTISGFKEFYGPGGDYSALNAEPFAGIGSGLNNIANGTLARGGAWGPGVVGTYNAGIFGFTTQNSSAITDNSIGFRCAFRPLAQSNDTQSVMPRYITPYTPNSGDISSVELGIKFTTSANGTVTKIRFYRAAVNAAGYTVNLWSSGGVLLGTGSGFDGTIPGWQEISLNTPVSITAGSDYVASYFTSNGLYPSHPHGYVTAYQGLGVLSAPIGAGVYNAGPGFPLSIWNNNNYYVDVVFEP